jgi:hypothetical protein
MISCSPIGVILTEDQDGNDQQQKVLLVMICGLSIEAAYA